MNKPYIYGLICRQEVTSIVASYTQLNLTKLIPSQIRYSRMSHNYEQVSGRKRSRSKTPPATSHYKRVKSASPATSSSSKSSTPSPEDWEMFPVVFEYKEGKLCPPANSRAKEAAEYLIERVDKDSFVSEKQKTLGQYNEMRLDYQSSNGGYSNLQIQDNKKPSRSVACALIQEKVEFGRNLIKEALSSSLERQKICRLSSTE